jgi:hypothetical protein
MSTWLLLGGVIVAPIIVGMALEMWENRRIDREAHSSQLRAAEAISLLAPPGGEQADAHRFL